MTTLPGNVGTPTSFLTDQEIKDALVHIFREGSYDSTCVRHASYQLRLGEVKVCSTLPQEHQDQPFEEFQTLRWKQDEDRAFVDISPGQIAMLYTKEFFMFPDDVIGFVVSRGLLFTLGLTPENTYVDPGFTRSLYITVVNNSHNIIQLHKDMPIARLFVFKLPRQVDRAYVAAADMGIEQQLKQIPVRAFWRSDEITKVRDAEILKSIESGCSIGDLLMQIIKRRIRSDAIQRGWLVVVSVLLLWVLSKPYLYPLLGRIPLPNWLSQEMFNLLMVAPAAAICLLVERGLMRYWDSRKGKKSG